MNIETASTHFAGKKSDFAIWRRLNLVFSTKQNSKNESEFNGFAPGPIAGWHG